MTAQCNDVTPGPEHDCGECCTSHCPGCTAQEHPQPFSDAIPSAAELRANGLFAAGGGLKFPGLA